MKTTTLHTYTHPSEGWTRCIEQVELPGGGGLIVTTTRQANPDGSFAIATSSCLAPGQAAEEAGKPPGKGKAKKTPAPASSPEENEGGAAD